MTASTQAAQAQRPKCLGVTKQGKPCPYRAGDGVDYCHRHDPAKAADRKAWTTSGGKAKNGGIRAVKAVAQVIASTPDAPKNMTEVKAQLGTVMSGVLSGAVLPEIAAAYGQLVGRYVQVAQALSMEALETQVRELQAEMDDQP